VTTKQRADYGAAGVPPHSRLRTDARRKLCFNIDNTAADRHLFRPLSEAGREEAEPLEGQSFSVPAAGKSERSSDWKHAELALKWENK
jgi:hypothetical protein